MVNADLMPRPPNIKQASNITLLWRPPKQAPNITLLWPCVEFEIMGDLIMNARPPVKRLPIIAFTYEKSHSTL